MDKDFNRLYTIWCQSRSLTACIFVADRCETSTNELPALGRAVEEKKQVP